MSKSIVLLGASGSIGYQTLDIVKKNPNSDTTVTPKRFMQLDMASFIVFIADIILLFFNINVFLFII